jgi:CHASE2 domain-containing sensor protein
MSGESSTPDKAARKKRYIRGIIYVVLLFALAFLEQWDEVVNRADCDRPTVSALLWYQRFCTLGHRKPRVHFVKLVTLSAETEPIYDRCEGREFTALLLERLAASSPSLIVIDRSYPPEKCPGVPSNELRAAIEHVSQTIPVIIGRFSQTEAELKADNDKDLLVPQKAGMKPDDQAITPTLLAENGTAIKYGLLRLDCDNRRIPLLWFVYQKSSPTPPKRESAPSLALAAAQIDDPETATRLAPLLRQNQHPFTSFLPESAFKPIGGMQVVCGGPLADINKWRDCPIQDNKNFGIRGKVLMIGERSSSEDRHDNILGPRIPGMVLQANYLESLLDDRYFTPLSRGVEIVLIVVCFVMVELIFHFSKSPHIGLLRSAAFVALLWSVCYVLMVEGGYIVTLWIPTSLAIFLTYVMSLKYSILE